MSLTREKKDWIVKYIEEEGFDNLFTTYTDFKDIDDKEFHELVNEYRQAVKKLSKYVGYEGYDV